MESIDIPKKYRADIRKFAKIVKNKKILVAYSAGLDSSVLLYLTQQFANECLAVMVVTEYIAQSDIERAKELVEIIGVPFKTLKKSGLKNPNIAQNPNNRCYYCKRQIMNHILDFKQEHGFDLIVEGTTIDDLNKGRPGLKALQDLQITSPFVEVGLKKQDLKNIAEIVGFPPKVYPANSCLATRVPYHTHLTTELLTKIEKAEQFVFELLDDSSIQLRVRVQILENSGFLARIEVKPKIFSMLVQDPNRQKIINKFKDLGFIYITLDLEGFRSGSMDY